MNKCCHCKHFEWNECKWHCRPLSEANKKVYGRYTCRDWRFGIINWIKSLRYGEMK